VNLLDVAQLVPPRPRKEEQAVDLTRVRGRRLCKLWAWGLRALVDTGRNLARLRDACPLRQEYVAICNR
jgi:hypothetical protein